ncbi:conserved phage C-terminal domain-containing protein [Tissierella carlieri]|uniref:Conserved phage C-terminal domain-containing protein n=1 Tax=Tissierella carlieri TaxID=689904 RepID=A0ABT1SFN6_9FIRM|nr:conserved phage C-terminal domain-containing protein [Tissierella carlieri]
MVEHLNRKTGKNFSHTTKSTTAKINARLAEGFTLDDLKKVIDIKTSEWLNDADMQNI